MWLFFIFSKTKGSVTWNLFKIWQVQFLFSLPPPPPPLLCVGGTAGEGGCFSPAICYKQFYFLNSKLKIPDENHLTTLAPLGSKQSLILFERSQIHPFYHTFKWFLLIIFFLKVPLPNTNSIGPDQLLPFVASDTGLNYVKNLLRDASCQQTVSISPWNLPC